MATITLGGNTIHTAGDLPPKGSDLSKIALTGIDLADFQLSKFAGKRIVLNIFPSIDTGVCATSVRKFNELAAGIDNTVVINVSKDLPFAQKRFCGAEGINDVVMGSDFRHQAFSENVKIDMIDGGMKDFMSRAIIVLDEQGKVVYTQQVPEIGQEPDYDEAIAAL
ncbi:MAG: thiol peroxidase [Salibacteraceae bacterium]